MAGTGSGTLFFLTAITGPLTVFGMSEIPDLLAQGCLRINFMPRLAQLPVFFFVFFWNLKWDNCF